MNLPYWAVFKIVMESKASKRLSVGAILSLAFSIAVILCTIGLMDGFELALRNGLQKSSGHIQLSQNESFFFNSTKLQKKISIDGNTSTPILQSEAFMLSMTEAKGVLLRGVDPSSFSKVTGMKVAPKSGEIILGKELFQNLGRPSDVEVLIGNSSQKNQGSSIIKTFKVAGNVDHGIHEKNLRFSYLNITDLRGLLEVKEKVVNLVIIKTADPKSIESSIKGLKKRLVDYNIIPYWREFQTLLDAVKIEKMTIGIVLQIIVVVAIFNVIAFIFFIMEKKSQDFFLLRALGLTARTLSRFWFITTIILWGISCVISIGLAHVFNWILANATFLAIPGDIYVLNELSLDLNIDDYLIVFGFSLLWMIIIITFALFRLKKQSLLKGLRQEFS